MWADASPDAPARLYKVAACLDGDWSAVPLEERPGPSAQIGLAGMFELIAQGQPASPQERIELLVAAVNSLGQEYIEDEDTRAIVTAALSTMRIGLNADIIYGTDE